MPISSPPASRSPSRAWLAAVAGAVALLLLLAWLSSGTLAPYGVTSDLALALAPCRYVVSTDHGHFLGAHLMLDGAPRQFWEWSVVLRRALYPALSYPLIKAVGFELGGFVFNLLAHAAAALAFLAFLRPRAGERASAWVGLLLACYPGIHYWIGLPYCYAAIVPASLLIVMALWRLEELDATRGRAVLGLSLAIGVLFLAYDLLPFFAPAAVVVAWRRTRRPGLVAAAAALLLAPTLAWLTVLSTAYGVPVVNDNSSIYGTVLRAWLNPGDLGAWGRLLADAPYGLAINFLASNFFALPLLWVALLALAGRDRPRRLLDFEVLVLLATLGLWALNNLAPPYPGKWQLRGDFIPRLYQPVFAVMLTSLARALQSTETSPRAGRRWGARGAALATALAGAAVVAGPWLFQGYTAQVYAAFYRHAAPEVMGRNLDVVGRRPLGFCGPER
jgi:hypothetical protein